LKGRKVWLQDYTNPHLCGDDEKLGCGIEKGRTFVIVGDAVRIVHEHLWCTILNVSDQVLLSLVTGEPLPRMEELRTPEVADPNVTIVANKHVIRLDVVVNNAQ
jgi:hypothetical protein